MRQHQILTLAVVASLAVIQSARAGVPAEQRLMVVESGDVFKLSVPVSRLSMTIPRNNLTVVHDSGSGGTASPRYFHLEDTTRGIIISGWFESANQYRGFTQFWKGETESWKKAGGPKPRNESLQKSEKWEMALYDVKVPGGSNTHIRAEWVDLGTWVDVHISVTSTEAIDAARATAMNVLKGIRVVPSS